MSATLCAEEDGVKQNPRKLTLHKYPTSWSDNVPDHVRKFFNHYRNIDKVYEEKQIRPRFFFAKDALYDDKFHSQKYLSSQNNDLICDVDSDYGDPAGPFIAMVKVKRGSLHGVNQECIYVPLSEIAQHKNAGWKDWDHPARPVAPANSEKPNIDLRYAPRVKDHFRNYVLPFNNTLTLFARSISLLKDAGEVENWVPGVLIIDRVCHRQPGGSMRRFVFDFDSEKQEAELKSSISCLPEPPQPANSLRTLRSATSCGHVHTFQRPFGIGLGWGGYDAFHEWQSHGRRIQTTREGFLSTPSSGGSYDCRKLRFRPEHHRGATSEEDEDVVIVSMGTAHRRPQGYTPKMLDKMVTEQQTWDIVKNLRQARLEAHDWY